MGFITENSSGSAAEPVLRRTQQRSILNSATEAPARLKTEVAAPDLLRLDQYFTDVRELERRLLMARGLTGRVYPNAGTGVSFHGGLFCGQA